jgi:hypothetical protein
LFAKGGGMRIFVPKNCKLGTFDEQLGVFRITAFGEASTLLIPLKFESDIIKEFGLGASSARRVKDVTSGVWDISTPPLPIVMGYIFVPGEEEIDFKVASGLKLISMIENLKVDEKHQLWIAVGINKVSFRLNRTYDFGFCIDFMKIATIDYVARIIFSTKDEPMVISFKRKKFSYKSTGWICLFLSILFSCIIVFILSLVYCDKGGVYERNNFSSYFGWMQTLLLTYFLARLSEKIVNSKYSLDVFIHPEFYLENGLMSLCRMWIMPVVLFVALYFSVCWMAPNYLPLKLPPLKEDFVYLDTVTYKIVSSSMVYSGDYKDIKIAFKSNSQANERTAIGELISLDFDSNFNKNQLNCLYSPVQAVGMLYKYFVSGGECLNKEFYTYVILNNLVFAECFDLDYNLEDNAFNASSSLLKFLKTGKIEPNTKGIRIFEKDPLELVGKEKQKDSKGPGSALVSSPSVINRGDKNVLIDDCVRTARAVRYVNIVENYSLSSHDFQRLYKELLVSSAPRGVGGKDAGSRVSFDIYYDGNNIKYLDFIKKIHTKLVDQKKILHSSIMKTWIEIFEQKMKMENVENDLLVANGLIMALGEQNIHLPYDSSKRFINIIHQYLGQTDRAMINSDMNRINIFHARAKQLIVRFGIVCGLHAFPRDNDLADYVKLFCENVSKFSSKEELKNIFFIELKEVIDNMFFSSSGNTSCDRLNDIKKKVKQSMDKVSNDVIVKDILGDKGSFPEWYGKKLLIDECPGNALPAN